MVNGQTQCSVFCFVNFLYFDRLFTTQVLKHIFLNLLSKICLNIWFYFLIHFQETYFKKRFQINRHDTVICAGNGGIICGSGWVFFKPALALKIGRKNCWRIYYLKFFLYRVETCHFVLILFYQKALNVNLYKNHILFKTKMKRKKFKTDNNAT